MSQPSTTRRTSIVSSTTPDSPLKATSIETRQVTSSVASTSALTPTTASTSASGSLSIPATSSSPSRKIDEQHKAQLASYKRDPARAAAANRINRVSEAWAGAGRRVSTVDEVDESGDGDDGKSKWKSKSSFLQTSWSDLIFVRWIITITPSLRLVHYRPRNQGQPPWHHFILVEKLPPCQLHLLPTTLHHCPKDKEHPYHLRRISTRHHLIPSKMVYLEFDLIVQSIRSIN